MARLLARGEEDIAAARTPPILTFIKELRRGRKIST
jgi:hypothetical protein